MKIACELTEETTTLTLTRAEALVLYDFVARFNDEHQLAIRDKAEMLLLFHIRGAFDRVLVEPFDPDYRSILRTARKTVRASSSV